MWFYGDSTSSRSWGVAIGFNKTMVFMVKEQLADPKERFLFIKGRLFNMDCTFPSIYSPNRKPDTFLRKTLKKLMIFKEGKLMIAGDLNMSIDPWLDTTRGPPRFPVQRQN